MTKKEVVTPHGDRDLELRKLAEDMVRSRTLESAAGKHSPDDALRIMHELQVHQMELEIQNDTLRHTQVELEIARDKYTALYEFAPTGYFTLDEKAVIIEANSTAAKLLKADKRRLIGRPLRRFVSAGSAEAYITFLKSLQAAGTEQSVLLNLISAGGTTFFGHLTGSVSHATHQSGPVMRLALTDITELVRTEQALQKSEEKYRTLISNLPAVTWSRDSKGEFTFVSHNVESVCGFKVEDVIGSDLRFWRRQIHPDDAPSVIHSFIRMLTHGEAVEVEYRFRRKDGTWIWLHSRALQRIEDHGAVRVDGILIDISERKRAEEMARDFQRKQAVMERQAALGQIAAAVAHEINNPLSGVQNAFLLLKKAVPVDHPNYRFAAMAEKELQRMAEIVRQMTLLYRPAAGKRCECNAVAAVQDILQMLSSDSRSHSVNFELSAKDEEMLIRMNESELRQVMYNILINAIQASPAGSVVRVSMDCTNGAARMSVTDAGMGIPEDILPRIFEPFFSTKRDEHNGMGLGLSVSRNLVEGAGGSIEVTSSLGKGSTFTVVLPCSKTKNDIVF